MNIAGAFVPRSPSCVAPDSRPNLDPFQVCLFRDLSIIRELPVLKRPRSPAVQLQSVAMRYRWPPRQRRLAAGYWLGSVRPPAAVKSAAAEGVDRDARMQRIEAILMLAREPISSRKLSEFANLADGTEARTLIRRLNRLNDEQSRAFRVEEVAGGYQMLSRPKFAAWLRRLGHVPHETRLSAPAMETLAVIAYRQPVLRADIEAIRGVNCGEILRQLMERDLVRISGRSEELGRPYLYATTRKFLQLFGFPNIDKLPRVETMRNVSGSSDSSRDNSASADSPPTPDMSVSDTASQSVLASHALDNFTPENEESQVSVTTTSELQLDSATTKSGRKKPRADSTMRGDVPADFIVQELDEDELEDDDFEDDDEDEDEEEFLEPDDDDDDIVDDDEEEEDDVDEEDEWEEVDDEDDEDWDDEDDDDLDWDDEDEEEEEEDEEEWD